MESLHTGVLRVRERTVLVELIEWGKFNSWRTHLTTALCHPRRYSSTPICQHRQISNVKNQSISKQKKLSLENGPGHYCSNNSTSDDETRKTSVSESWRSTYQMFNSYYSLAVQFLMAQSQIFMFCIKNSIEFIRNLQGHFWSSKLAVPIFKGASMRSWPF